MGKKKKKKNDLIGMNFGDKSIIVLITNSLDKHGKIKGKTKKETKALRDICPHHTLNKRGKVKPKYRFDADTKTCTCRMCNHSWSATVENMDKIHKKAQALQENVDQAKIFNVGVNGGERTQRYLSELSIGINHFPKVYGRLSKIAQKQDKNRKNKKKNRQNVGSSQYGSWR